MRVVFRCDPALYDRLPRPVAARGVLPDWLRAMPASAFSELHGQEVRTVKQCPPFVDAMAHGFLIPLPCDVTVRDGRFSWAWDLPPLSVEAHPRSPLSFHVPAQVTGTPFHDEGSVVIKFNSFWTIELDSGYSLFATHPVNRADLPFRLLTGLVDSIASAMSGFCSRRSGSIQASAASCRPEHPSRNVSRSRATPPSLSLNRSRKRRSGVTTRPAPRCCRGRASIGGATARGGRDDHPASEPRSAAMSSHTSPIGAAASACSQMPCQTCPARVGVNSTRNAGFGRGHVAGFLMADAEIDRGLREIRPDLERAPVGLGRSGEVALVLSDETHREPGIAAPRREADGALERRGRTVALAHPAQAETELERRIGAFRRLVCRGTVGVDSLSGSTEGFQQRAAAQMQRERGLGLPRPREGDERRLRLSGALQGGAEQAPSVRLAGKPIEQQRQQRTGLGIAAFEQRHARQKSGIGPAGREIGGAAKECKGAGKVFRRARGAAGHDQGGNVIGATREARRRRAHCLLNLAAL